MDVLSFLTQGNVKPNPEYNPKTKKGKWQAPTLVDYNPGTSIHDTLTSNIANVAAPNLYSFNTEDVNKYAEYNTYLSPAYTEEELNRERAENQSAFEQTLRAVGQGIVNEALIGGIAGFSNLFDAGVNAIQYAIDDNHVNDFTNPVSKYLEDVQNNIREEWEIYRKDPNASFALSDFGWWADNFVSVATTASMLLPTVGTSRALSLAGKAIRTAAKTKNANSVVKGLDKLGTTFSAEHISKVLADKYGSKFKYLNDSGKVADKLLAGRQIVQNAVMSRTIEGYLEAREVYNQMHDEAFNTITNFTDEEHTEFINNNPELKGMTDEEMANYIAGKSAEETFRNDYAMLLMDVLQFRALGSLYKSGKKLSNANLALTAQKAKNKILGITNKNVRPQWIDDNIFRLKYMAKHPFDGLAGITWSEAIEEGYQGIQTEKGKEVGRKILDPTFTPRELKSYLTDPAILEQAVWGVLGGVSFGAISKGLNKISNKISHSDAVRNWIYDPATVAYMKLADQKARSEGIEGWADNVAQFTKAINDIKDGKDINNITGQTKINKDGVLEYGQLTDTQIKYQLDRTINDFVTDMALNAEDRGNFDIFKEFITDPEIVKHIQEQTNSNDGSTVYVNKLLEKLEQVSDTYNRETYKLRNNVHVNNPFVARKIAREAVRARLNINDLNTELANTEAELNDLLGDNQDSYLESETNTFASYIRHKLKQLDDEEKRHLKEYSDNLISKQAYDEYLQDINKSRKALVELAHEQLLPISQNSEFSELFSALQSSDKSGLDTSSLNEFLNKFDAFASQIQHTTTQNQSEPITNLMTKKIALLYNIKYAESQLPNTKADYEREYAQHAMLIDKLTRKRYDDAVDNVLKWIEQQPDLNEAKRALYNNEVTELKQDLDLLKIGHKTTANFWSAIDFALMDENRKRQIAEEAKRHVTVDGQPVEGEQVDNIRSDIEHEDEDRTDEQPSFTGQQEEAEMSATNDTTEPIVPAKPVATNQPIIDDTSFGKLEIPVAQNTEINIENIQAQAAHANDINIAEAKAYAVVRDMSIDKNSKFNNINNDNANEVIDEITRIIANETYIDEDICYNCAKEAVQTKLKMLVSAYNRKGKDTSNLVELINNIALQERYSATGDIESIQEIEQQHKLIEDFINEYFRLKGIKKTKSGNATINLLDLYETVLNTDTVTQSEALEFFRQFQGFLNDTNKRDLLNNYRFLNLEKFRKLVNNPVRLREVIEDIKNSAKWNSDYMHIAISNSNPNAADIARRIKRDEELTAIYEPYNETGSSQHFISFRYNGEEVGYIATVEANSDNNSFTFRKRTGFRYTVRKIKDANGNDDYRLNDIFEEVMSGLLDESSPNFEKYDWLRSIIERSGNPSLDDLDKLINSGIINKFIEDGLINSKDRYKHTIDKYTLAKSFLKDIINIKYYNKNDATLIQRYKSYKIYCKKLYDNAVFTHNLMLAKEAKVKFVNTWDGLVLYSNDEQWECGDKRYNFNAKDNPIVGVNPNRKFIIEGKVNEVPNPNRFKPGTIGFLLRLHNNAAIIAMITGSKMVSNQDKYNKLLQKELFDMFSNYLKEDNTYDYEHLVADLEALVSGPTVPKHKPVLFRGLSVIKNANGSMSLGYKDADENYHYVLKINKYKYGTNEEKFDIRWIKNNREVRIHEDDKIKLTNCVKDIINYLKFNASYITLLNNKSNDNSTRFCTINKDGSIDINIGSETNHYDSFTDFALKENIFYTNQEVNEHGGFFDEEASNSLFVDSQSVITTKKSGVVPLNEYYNLDSKTPIATNNFLDSVDIDNDIQSFLLGNNQYGISLIPDTIYFDSSMPATKNVKSRYNKRDDKIYIGKALLNSSLNKDEVIRALMHEQLHRQFSQLDSATKTKIVNDLLNTYNATYEALQKDLNSEDENKRTVATAILKWFETNKFNPKDYGSILPSRDKKRYYNASEDKQLAIFMEEWLVESITRPQLREYLNTVEYGTAVVGEPQTILAKLLKLLMKIFGKNPAIVDKNINNNTILATQFNILNGQDINNDNTTNNKSIVVKRDTEKIEDNEIDTSSTQSTDASNTETKNIVIDTTMDTENEFTEFDDLNDLNDDFDYKDDDSDMFSTTTDLEIEEIEDITDATVINYVRDTKTNPKGIISISDMTEYLNRFNVQDRPIIEKALNDRTIQYMCY